MTKMRKIAGIQQHEVRIAISGFMINAGDYIGPANPENIGLAQFGGVRVEQECKPFDTFQNDLIEKGVFDEIRAESIVGNSQNVFRILAFPWPQFIDILDDHFRK